MFRKENLKDLAVTVKGQKGRREPVRLLRKEQKTLKKK
jgi:hypothetical protein